MPQAVLGANANVPHPLLLPTVLPHPPVNSEAVTLSCLRPFALLLPCPECSSSNTWHSCPSHASVSAHMQPGFPASPTTGPVCGSSPSWHGPHPINLDLLVLIVPSGECLFSEDRDLRGCSWLEAQDLTQHSAPGRCCTDVCGMTKCTNQ